MKPVSPLDAEDQPDPFAPSVERATAIGSRLRQIFDEAAAEPMPQAFEDLLRKLG